MKTLTSSSTPCLASSGLTRFRISACGTAVAATLSFSAEAVPAVASDRAATVAANSFFMLANSSEE